MIRRHSTDYSVFSIASLIRTFAFRWIESDVAFSHFIVIFFSIKTQSSTRLVSKLYFSISLYSFCSCSFSLYHLFCGRAHKTSRKLRQVYEHLYTGTVRVLNFKLSNSTMFHVNVFAWLLALARFEHKLSASQGPPVLFLDGMHVTLHWSPAGAGCWNGVGL